MKPLLQLNWLLASDIFRTFPPYKPENFDLNVCLKHENLKNYSESEILSTIRRLIQLDLIEGELIAHSFPVMTGITNYSMKFCLAINEDANYERVKNYLSKNPSMDLIPFLELVVTKR